MICVLETAAGTARNGHWRFMIPSRSMGLRLRIGE
jgi:hypothetical protein